MSNIVADDLQRAIRVLSRQLEVINFLKKWTHLQMPYDKSLDEGNNQDVRNFDSFDHLIIMVSKNIRMNDDEVKNLPVKLHNNSILSRKYNDEDFDPEAL